MFQVSAHGRLEFIGQKMGVGTYMMDKPFVYNISMHSGTSLIRMPLGRVLVSSLQGASNTYLYEIGTWSSVLNSGVSFKRVPL